MNWLHAVIFGIVEGIVEFLSISSTGHLNIAEKLFGYEINSGGMTAFTAMIQMGAILTAIIYFWKDIARIVVARFKGLANKAARQDLDYTLGWGVILGSTPVAVVGLPFKDFTEGPVRSMWVTAEALIVWSAAMWLVDCQQNPTKGTKNVSIKDALVIGCFQALSPVLPGISRSGATISAGLFLCFDRVTAIRLSFSLGIPAPVAAGDLKAITAGKHIADASIGWGSMIVVTVVSGVVAYTTIAWLLKFVFSDKPTSFLTYHVIPGAVIIVLIPVGLVTV